MKCIENTICYFRQVRIMFAVFLVLMLVTTVFKPANANAVYQLKVTYSSGSILSGPLSFGLTSLPSTVTAVYTLGVGQDDIEGGSRIYFNKRDVVTANVTFGDATWTTTELKTFSMSSSLGKISSLTYEFLPTTSSQAAHGGIVLNFPLSIIGTDLVTGEDFAYEYTQSTQTLTTIPQIKTVGIDIKPGSSPNCFNVNGHGVIPVAILGGSDFDVGQIDLTSLSFGGLAVRIRGNKGALCSIEYSNTDAYLDLVCQFEDDVNNWQTGDDKATLTGSLIDSMSFSGTDTICVVP